jgi:hypothetical protein
LGFLGQKVQLARRQIGRWQAFVRVGIGIEFVALAILLAFVKRRGLVLAEC